MTDFSISPSKPITITILLHIVYSLLTTQDTAYSHTPCHDGLVDTLLLYLSGGLPKYRKYLICVMITILWYVLHLYTNAYILSALKHNTKCLLNVY